MKRMASLLSLGLLLLGTAAYPQFAVTSSRPANGEAGVPLSATVSFSFSAPLDTSMRYGEAPYPVSLLSPDPATPLTVEAISYSVDLKTVSFHVTHAPDTDYVWMLAGARGATGEMLARPFALNYTTAATAGRYAVSGTVAMAGGDPASTLVGLFDKPLFGEEEIVPLAAAVTSGAAGAYLVTPVRDGIYWPVAAKDLDGDGMINPESGDALGFYDPDQDGQPDSVVVAGSDLVGVDFGIGLLFAPVTARYYLDTAVGMARQYAPDQELRAIIAHADTVGLDGTSVFWFYQFYSPSLEFPTRVLASSMGVQVDTARAGEPQLPPNTRPIPLEFVDSDVALAAAEAGGGEEFRTQHHLVRRTLYGGNMGWTLPQDTTRVAWVVQYEGIDADGTSQQLRLFVDMLTGESLPERIAAVTARTYLDTAVERARQYAPDQELRAIVAHADTVGLDGTSVFWLYQFYSPSLQFQTRVFASLIGVQVDTARAGGPEFPPNMRPIPPNFVDSDVALAAAEAAGGRTFRSRHRVVRRSLYGGNVWWALPQDTTRVYWGVQYEGIGPDSTERVFRAFVDMLTGELVLPAMTAVLESEAAVPRAFSLAQNFPNPFNPVTTIRFSLPHQARVRLQVLDLLGREVATLVDGVAEAGEHAVVFAAKGLAAGVYFYRLEADGSGQTRKLVLLK